MRHGILSFLSSLLFFSAFPCTPVTTGLERLYSQQHTGASLTSAAGKGSAERYESTPTPTRSASTAHPPVCIRRAHHSDVAHSSNFETEEGVPQTEAVPVSCPEPHAQIALLYRSYFEPAPFARVHAVVSSRAGLDQVRRLQSHFRVLSYQTLHFWSP